MLSSVIFASFCGLGLSFAAAPPRDALVRAGQDLYHQGKFDQALLKFEDAIAQGAQAGELFYQTGYCYRVARMDGGKSLEYMKKALPLLEALPEKDLSRCYYLTSAYINEVKDSVKGSAEASRCVALADQGAFKAVRGSVGLFQVARVHTLAGARQKAVPWYKKAIEALQKEPDGSKQYLLMSYQFLVSSQIADKDYVGASESYRRILALGGDVQNEKIPAALVMVKAGKYNEAIEALKGITNDDQATQANYLSRVLTRYVALGAAPASRETTALDDAGLQEAIGKSATKLGEVRKKEEDALAKLPPEEPPYTWRTTKSGKKVKVYRPQIIPPTEEVIPKDPNNVTQEEHDRMVGWQFDPPKPAPPPSAERVAAEKEFFGLLVEYVRRGHLLQEYAVSRGFMSLIFR